MKEPVSLRAVIADDEKLAREYLTRLLAEHPEVEVVAECRDGLEAVKAIAAHKPDLVFLDIEMPRLDGFEVLEISDPNVAVVFVTAYDSYAVRAFETHAIDYLLKPYSDERLAAALARVKARVGATSAIDPAALRREMFRDTRFAERIAIKDGAEIFVVDTRDVDYVTAEDDYVEIRAQGRAYLKHQTMSALEKALDPARFVRIHRSCIANVERVARVEAETKDKFAVLLKDGTWLSASRDGVRRLRQVLGI